MRQMRTNLCNIDISGATTNIHLLKAAYYVSGEQREAVGHWANQLTCLHRSQIAWGESRRCCLSCCCLLTLLPTCLCCLHCSAASLCCLCCCSLLACAAYVVAPSLCLCCLRWAAFVQMLSHYLPPAISPQVLRRLWDRYYYYRVCFPE